MKKILFIIISLYFSLLIFFSFRQILCPFASRFLLCFFLSASFFLCFSFSLTLFHAFSLPLVLSFSCSLCLLFSLSLVFSDSHFLCLLLAASRSLRLSFSSSPVLSISFSPYIFLFFLLLIFCFSLSLYTQSSQHYLSFITLTCSRSISSCPFSVFLFISLCFAPPVSRLLSYHLSLCLLYFHFIPIFHLITPEFRIFLYLFPRFHIFLYLFPILKLLPRFQKFLCLLHKTIYHFSASLIPSAFNKAFYLFLSLFFPLFFFSLPLFLSFFSVILFFRFISFSHSPVFSFCLSSILSLYPYLSLNHSKIPYGFVFVTKILYIFVFVPKIS